MTPQELKNSIIQLAMQGKLVDQIESEGTGADLLHQITRARKQLGIRDNKKVEPITEDILPFDIPSSWCWARFGNIVTYNMGKTPPRAETQWWENDFPWVSIADMPENGHITSTKEGVSRQAIVEKFGNRFSPAGTMIMSFKLTVGRVSILDIDAVHNEAIISIFPLCDSDNCLKQYLFHLLPTITQYGDSKNAIKGKTLNDTSISNLLIPLPPFAEQKRIVAKIEELLPLIDRYEQAWSRLEDFNKRFPGDMQKSILQMAVQGKLVEQRPQEGTGEELYQKIQAEKRMLIKTGKIKKEKPLPEIPEDDIPFEIPESWKWVRIGKIVNGLFAGGDKPSDFSEKADDTRRIPVIANGITNDGILGYTATPTAKANTITVAGRGTIGFSLFREYEYCPVVRLIVIEQNSNVYPQYLQRVLQALPEKSLGTSIPQLTVPMLYPKLIPLPPLSEQKRIVARLEELLPLCERLKL